MQTESKGVTPGPCLLSDLDAGPPLSFRFLISTEEVKTACSPRNTGRVGYVGCVVLYLLLDFELLKDRDLSHHSLIPEPTTTVLGT